MTPTGLSLRVGLVIVLATFSDGCANPPASAAGPSPAPATIVSTPSSREPASVAGITAAHNRVRARVGVPPLEWNARLADVARRWASACVDAVEPRGMIDHGPGRAEGFPGPVGENIWGTTAATIDPAFAVEGWASEARDYDYASNTCRGSMCGHYTQLVWRGTGEVGCAVASCPKLRFGTALVCNYWPAGNWVGERPY
jgi:hypothetical protein